MKHVVLLSALLMFATPVLAFEIEEIGSIEATFGDERIAQRTVIARNGSEGDATAFLMAPGGGFTALSLAGLDAETAALGLAVGVDYMSLQPGPETAPMRVEITYTPAGGGYWSSDEAPTPPNVTFTTLEFDDAEGRAVGAFSGLLCYAEAPGAEPDAGNCRPVDGGFDTRFFVEE